MNKLSKIIINFMNILVCFAPILPETPAQIKGFAGKVDVQPGDFMLYYG